MSLKYFFTLLCLWTVSFGAMAQGLDYDWLKSINSTQNSSSNGIWKGVSESAGYLSIGAPVAITAVGLLKKDANLQREGLTMGVALGATFVETYLLKRLISRDRPAVTHPDLVALSTETSYAMPSGHTSAAFSVATSLSLEHRQWYVVAPAFLWASAVGYSRLHLAVHYPSDVVAGAALGTATAWATWRIQRWWQRRNIKK